MKKKLFFAGMLVCVLAFGMIAVGCGGNEEEPNADPKTIVITGLADKSGTVMIMVFSSLDEDGQVAGGYGTISNASVELPLYVYESIQDETPSRWTGNGSYYLAFMFDEDGDGASYVFTDGKTLEADMANLPKYSINAAKSTIAFAKFKKFGE
ncbi:MAG: hypothetical protein LBD58_03330 [Treponema sp.]|jgi:uncharacterized protein (DUF2141 family)|nr:hypothetical protein [Treponema sp.]